ncbi:MAG: YggS family pyridoxal phosphate-dependent enzyme [Proteobacteria bacterium]|nr:YggS family pyridoxal phosphate-dependent enzyme [Pseudomonadota bacterium]
MFKTLNSQYQAVLNRLETAKKNSSNQQAVQLIAVSKKHSIKSIRSVYKMGQKDFAESYAQEAVKKIEALKNCAIIWHFIGPIQSNKTRLIAENFDWVQSVDRTKTLKRIDTQRPSGLNPIKVLLQLKIGDETSKSGANIEQLEQMIDISKDLPNICLRGLMCIPPASQDVLLQAHYFQQANKVFNQFQSIKGFDTLSMGMSNDLEAAINNGSTMLRIGTDIFGARK